MSNFQEKSITKVYGPTLFYVRRGCASERVSNFPKKTLQTCTVQRYLHYDGMRGVKCSGKQHYKDILFKVIYIPRT